MKRILWLGLIFLSVRWLCFIRIFTLPSFIFGIFFLTCGIVFNIIGFWNEKTINLDIRYLIIFLPLFLSIFIIPFPYNLGLICISLGLIIESLYIFFKSFKKHSRIQIGFLFSGLILTVHACIMPIIFNFTSRVHRVDFLSPLINFFARIFGLNTSVSNGIVFVDTVNNVLPYTTSLEKLGFYPWIFLLIGAFVIFFFISNPKKIMKNVFIFFILSFLYLIFRYLFVLYMFIEFKTLFIFTDPIILFISFLPLIFLFIKFIPLKDLEIDFKFFEKFRIEKKQLSVILIIFMFVFSTLGIFLYYDPGEKKNGSILIDEFHSDWESTTIEMNKKNYGLLSTYNYYSWAEWLDNYFNVDINNNKSLNLELIDSYDILIIKCPTYSFDNNEIKSIVNFVKNGGGLYLIGDHTNVFGMNSNLNKISEKFGITFNADATYDIYSGQSSKYEPDSIGSHPIVQSMPSFHFLTSCTLDVPINSESVITGYGLLTEPGTYSTINFFRENHESADMEFGFFNQVTALKYGKGRVVAFTDSTCFSNFCIFMDGYRSFNLGVINYLNRTNRYSYINNIFLAISLISFCLTIFLLRKEKKNMLIFLFLFSGLIAFSLALPSFDYLNKVNYSSPEAHSDFTKIYFDESHSDFVISPSYLTTDTTDHYSTFFVWTQRLGYVPYLENNLINSINKGDAIVIINPINTFSDKEIKLINNYIKDGGKVLLIDGALNTESTANELLNNFGIHLEYGIDEESLKNQINNITLGNTTSPHLTISGGEKILINENNKTKVVYAEKGEGIIAVFVDSYCFNDVIMGGRLIEPTEFQKEIYNTEFFIFEEILFKDKD